MLEKYKIGEKVNINHFVMESRKIRKDDSIYKRINGRTYYPNNDIRLEDLVYIRLLHYNYKKEIVVGELIVNKLIEDDIRKVFEQLFNARYEINSLRLIDDYWVAGDASKTDRNSILHNNSSSFFYRKIIENDTLSNHALGLAIDINPLDNPYTPRNNDGTFDTSLLSEYELAMLENREKKAKNNSHIITLGDELCQIFKNVDFECGGIWPLQSELYSCDWQHFEPIPEKRKVLLKKMRDSKK